MTDDDDVDDVYVYTEVHKRYFELFALQEQYGGGNHVITTSEPPEVAVEFINQLLMLSIIKAWSRDSYNKPEYSPDEYIVIIEPNLEVASEHARTFESQLQQLQLQQGFWFESDRILILSHIDNDSDEDNPVTLGVVFTTPEMREHDIQRWSGYPYYMFCAYPGLFDQQQIATLGYGSAQYTTFRQVVPPSPPSPCKGQCVGVAPAIGQYSQCMCHIATFPMFE